MNVENGNRTVWQMPCAFRSRSGITSISTTCAFGEAPIIGADHRARAIAQAEGTLIWRKASVW